MQTIMPQIDMQIQKHIENNDQARKYDEKMQECEMSVNSSMEAISKSLDGAKK